MKIIFGMDQDLLKIFYCNDINTISDISTTIKQNFIRLCWEEQLHSFEYFWDEEPIEFAGMNFNKFGTFLSYLETIGPKKFDHEVGGWSICKYSDEVLRVKCLVVMFEDMRVLVGCGYEDWYFEFPLSSDCVLHKLIVEKCGFLGDLKKYVSNDKNINHKEPITVFKEFLRARESRLQC